MHEPQLTKPPQPFEIDPQTWPSVVHLAVASIGVQPHTPAVPPPPQVFGEVHPHMTVPPHPFERLPHAPPTHGLIGVHPHCPAVPPPPQVFEPVHPHMTELPHESATEPHFTPSHGLPLGVQPH